MIRHVLLMVGALLLSGCAALPVAGYAAIGAGFGYLASVNNLAAEVLKVWDERNPSPAPRVLGMPESSNEKGEVGHGS